MLSCSCACWLPAVVGLMLPNLRQPESTFLSLHEAFILNMHASKIAIQIMVSRIMSHDDVFRESSLLFFASGFLLDSIISPPVAEWSKALESDASAGGESPVRAPVRAATLCPYA